MNDREIEIVHKSTPKQHYYVVSPAGRRLISLGLGGVALSFVGVSGREDRQIVQECIENFPKSWQSEWLMMRGHGDWAHYLDQKKGVPV